MRIIGQGLGRSRRRLFLVLVDVALVICANLLACFLRFDEVFPTTRSTFLLFHRWLLIDILLTPVVFWVHGLYRASWRYASVRDLVRIVQAVMIRTAAVILAFVGLGYDGLPRSVAFMDAVLLLLFVGGARLITRVHGELRRKQNGGRPVLIVGAGESGEMIVREMRRRVDLEYLPVGFIDDDEEKHGVMIHGVPILGGREDIPDVVRSRGVTEVIVAIPSASARDLREIRELCGDPKIRLKAVPAVADMLGGPVGLQQLREVAVEDLLGREPVVLDAEAIRRDISGHTVLVTGGGGSIGRELARQVLALRPARLVLVDRSENNLFNIGRELVPVAGDETLICCIGDIQDEIRMREIFVEHRPRVVYHAAAYKHVPMMEYNPLEAVSNNVFGTQLLARLSAEVGASRFVLISTDKAVNPVSVMGKTKRAAELILQSLGKGETRFIAVRFGNVLGSDGSVVPIFREQIRTGGPVTVTHPEATRYFMTIPEAVQLVMQAGTMGQGGEIFMLDMGRPVPIVDLARNLIELSGLRPNVDIDIVFTGLRPGEKLHEELNLQGELTRPTSHEKIVMLSTPPIAPEELRAPLEELRLTCRERRTDEVSAQLSRLVDRFAPASPRPGKDPRPRPSGGRLREAYT